MRLFIIPVLFIWSLTFQFSFGQNPDGFGEMAVEMADKSVPLIKARQAIKLESKGKKIVYLDAREQAEYDMSHIKDAVHIGYNKFDKNTLVRYDKDAVYVVYCSVGYRSGQIGKKMMKLGFKNVFNLYGGLFDWANNGNPIYKKDKQVKKVHPYDNKWGKWLRKELWGSI